MTASHLPGLAGGQIRLDTRESRARRHPGRTAVTFTDRLDPTTHAELDDRSTRIANALAERGIRAGDHIAFLLPTGPAIVEAARRRNGAV